MKEGYLTVFLSLILSIMISLCLTLILGVRESTRRLEIECVTDIGMNSILAEYSRELLKQYDLFFIDTSYGSTRASYENTAAHLKEYVTYNIEGDDLFLSGLLRNPLKLSLQGIDMTEVSVASDEDGSVLRRQAVEVMYQRIGLTYLQQLEEWLKVVDSYDMAVRDIGAEQKAAADALKEWDDSLTYTDEKEAKTTFDNPSGTVASFWEAGILNLVVEDTEELSIRSINPAEYISSRTLLAGTGMASAIEFADSWWEQLLFQEYILAYTRHYGEEKESGCLQYQVEYILSGKENDLDNLKAVVYELLAIRAVADTVTLASDKEKMRLLEIASKVIATLLTQPEIAPLIQTLLFLTWAMAESIYDVSQLMQGGRVPLLKSSGEWHYDLTEIFDFQGGSDDEVRSDSGLSYADYLRILLCLQNKKTTTFRLMDIMEMDIRQTPGNRYFRMDGCIDSLTATLYFTGSDRKSYQITRSYGY